MMHHVANVATASEGTNHFLGFSVTVLRASLSPYGHKDFTSVLKFLAFVLVVYHLFLNTSFLWAGLAALAILHWVMISHWLEYLEVKLSVVELI